MYLRADVIASTCIGAGDEALMNLSFNICVIDEATQVWPLLILSFLFLYGSILCISFMNFHG